MCIYIYVYVCMYVCMCTCKYKAQQRLLWSRFCPPRLCSGCSGLLGFWSGALVLDVVHGLRGRVCWGVQGHCFAVGAAMATAREKTLVRRLDIQGRFATTRKANKVHGVHLCTRAGRTTVTVCTSCLLLSVWVLLTGFCMSQDSRLMPGTASPDHSPVLIMPSAAQTSPRLTIPSVAKSMFMLQTMQLPEPSSAPSKHVAPQPAVQPRIVLLDTLDEHHVPFLSPPQPCLHVGLGCDQGADRVCDPGARRSSIWRRWTEVMAIVEPSSCLRGALGPPPGRIKQICLWYFLDLCSYWRTRAANSAPVLLVQALNSFCALAHLNVVWDSLSFLPLSDWAFGLLTGAPSQSTLYAAWRVLSCSPSYQLGYHTGLWLEESSPVPWHLHVSSHRGD